MKWWKLAGIVVWSLTISTPVHALPSDPFGASAELTARPDGTRQLTVSLSVPDKHYLYADKTEIETTSGALKPIGRPEATRKDDPFTGETVEVYKHDVTFTYAVTGMVKEPFDVTVSYQGCSDKICFLPATHVLSVGATNGLSVQGALPAAAGVAASRVAQDGDQDWRRMADGFTRGGSASGYLPADEFLVFLSSARAGGQGGDVGLQRVVERKGWVLTFLLIVLGGLALNLTPCVLPMIPVNLAIIGAGAEASNKRRGLALGSAFGLGMALVYGVLGVVVILTGATFGTLNGSPWFNAVIAVLFVFLALAMFDVVHIDFSRFQSRTGGGEVKRGSLAAAFVMGGVMALLAGACVAPVVISVLLFATDLYAAGHSLALFLPFLLGIGMAAPWPFAGAGLSFLPRPGRWMQYVKYGFGVIILAVAVYYGHLAVQLVMDRSASARQHVEQVQAQSLKEGWMDSLPEALALAVRQDKPVLIDFWASWCKSCLHMEKTTFREPAVTQGMEPFVKVKYRAENPNDPEIKRVLDYFGVLGLPTYVVLVPGSGGQ